jgi:hypothetical protein
MLEQLAFFERRLQMFDAAIESAERAERELELRPGSSLRATADIQAPAGAVGQNSSGAPPKLYAERRGPSSNTP